METYIDVKRIDRPTLNDGIYFISFKTSQDNTLSIYEKSLNEDASVVNSHLTKNAQQCFFIRYIEKDDCYTIMALHSHLFLGVPENKDYDYLNTLIYQHSLDEKYIQKWIINSCDDKYFNITLYGTIYNFEYNNDLNLPQLNLPNDDDNQKLIIKILPIINEGFYTIGSKLNNNIIISFTGDSTQNISVLSKKDNKNPQIFYVKMDVNDGCYSIFNVFNNLCLSTDRNSSMKSPIGQNKFYNLDYQKWIISSQEKGYFFLELKSNLLRIDASNKANNNMIQLKLENFILNNPIKNQQLFSFNSVKFNAKDSTDLIKNVESMQNMRYQTTLYLLQKEINEQLLENSFYLQLLTILPSVSKISERAFVNCKNIKKIQCDSKWLNLLPNPSKIEAVVIIEGVTEIRENDFKNFRNLLYLVLPKSLQNVHVNAFQDINNLVVFVGNPKYLDKIYKYSLIEAKIPSHITTIPKEAFKGCKKLEKVEFLENSNLKEIQSLAFANCESLKNFNLPQSVENIAPDAFQGCTFKPLLSNEKQKLSMIDNLIIDSNVSKITKEYASFINIISIEIPLSVTEIEDDVLNNFKYLKFIKCDPKWLIYIEPMQIEMVYIQNGVKQISKKYFDKLINLKFIDIPESVDIIEKNSFSNCKNLSSYKCGIKHLKHLNKETIKNLMINKSVKKIEQNDFDEIINLESCYVPEKIKIDGEIFANCKKLMKVNASIQNLINNYIVIQNGITTIYKEQFQGWINLQALFIAPKMTKIDEGTFDDCINIKQLSCDPKWFHLFPRQSIRELAIPANVDEIKKSQFDGFDSLTSIALPDKIAIDNPEIFDSCESLLLIKCNPNLFHTLSEKTRKRCIFKYGKYTMPNFNFNPNNDSNNDITKETTAFDLVAFDSDNEKYYQHIMNVLNYTEKGEYQKDYEPQNSNLSEISKVCGSVCYEINQTFHIALRPVQILVVLRMADEILNNKKSHGSIGEIKTGEGKSLIITVLSIVIVKYNRKIDIVTSNLQLAKRDHEEQKQYFNLFDIKTGILYNDKYDDDFLNKSMINCTSNDQSIFESYNTNVFKFPVIYSTNSNYQFVYLHSIFELNIEDRVFDVVLVDEVDNMFIDEFYSPSIIGHNIQYAYSKDIFQIVYLLHKMKTSEIRNVLKYFLPNCGKFEENDIEILKNAAKLASCHKKNVDYIIENGQIVIIDSNTGFKKLGTRWGNYIHEMIEIKEGITPQNPTVSLSLITQHSYFNLYNKIIGVTGTVGGIEDEELLKEGYNVNIFKVPRHFQSHIKTMIKTRPNSLPDLYDAVRKEIIKEKNKGRPVLVIWDSIENAKNFINSKYSLNHQEILGINLESEKIAIKNAGNAETITIATSAAGRGVDIKLSAQSLEAGGLHVIIPMAMSNQRSLEQAAGRAGRQGQPGSVTFYKSNDDNFHKSKRFSKHDENLVKIELSFAKYLKENFPWMLSGPRKSPLHKNVFPYAADYNLIMNILAKQLALCINFNPFKEYSENFKHLALNMVLLSWGTFFSDLYHNEEDCNDYEFCKDAYKRFIKSLNYWFDPIKSNTVIDSVRYIRSRLLKEIDWKYFIVSGVKITIFSLCIIFPPAAPYIYILGNLLLVGGVEVYNQLQSGNDVDWYLVLTRTGLRPLRLAVNFIGKAITFQNTEFFNMIFYCFEIKVRDKLFPAKKAKKFMISNEDIDEEECVNEYENKPKIVTLSNGVNVFSIDTETWIFFNLNEKDIENESCKRKNKYSNISKFMPKVKPETLNIDFIRMAMSLAKDSYDGNFCIGKSLFKTEDKDNDIYKPMFYCIEFNNNIYIVTRGSASKPDFLTDIDCKEVRKEINEKEIYFHRGFYKAAKYVFDLAFNWLTGNYKTIYFIGHSYGASVSSVLCLLAKTHERLKNKKIFSMAFAPAPAMSFCPPYIAECIFAFINREDIVPSFSLSNTLNSARRSHLSLQNYISNCIEALKFIERILDIKKFSNLIPVLEESLDIVVRNEDINVKKVKGVVFRIGMLSNKRLLDCRLYDSELPSKLTISLTSIADHFMDEYIKSFEIINI